MNNDEIIKELESLMQKIKQESKEPDVYFLSYCPFCGSSVDFDQTISGHRVYCPTCQCSTTWFRNKSDAAKTWNERV